MDRARGVLVDGDGGIDRRDSEMVEVITRRLVGGRTLVFCSTLSIAQGGPCRESTGVHECTLATHGNDRAYRYCDCCKGHSCKS